jgi:serine/threonine protein kinase
MEGFIYDVYQGLLYLARRGIVHRDIKISNILVRDGRAKIADFGFANTNTYQSYNFKKS